MPGVGGVQLPDTETQGNYWGRPSPGLKRARAKLVGGFGGGSMRVKGEISMRLPLWFITNAEWFSILYWRAVPHERMAFSLGKSSLF